MNYGGFLQVVAAIVSQQPLHVTRDQVATPTTS